MNSQTAAELRCRNPDKLGLRKEFTVGDRNAVTVFLQDWSHLGLHHLRLTVPSTAWQCGPDSTWYTWLLSRLGGTARLCVSVLPDALHIFPNSAQHHVHASLVQLLEQYGSAIDAVEFPALEWELRLGSAWPGLCRRIAESVHAAGLRYLLSGAHWQEPGFVSRCSENGILSIVDALGVDMEAGTAPHRAAAPTERLREIEQLLKELGIGLPLWLSRIDVQGSAPRPFTDVETMQDALTSGAERIYWDVVDAGIAQAQAAGSLNLPTRFLCTKPDSELRRVIRFFRSPRSRGHDEPHVLITGGAGFVGANLADRLLGEGERVTIYDNLSRPGTEHNVQWLKSRHGERLTFYLGDIRDTRSVANIVEHATHVFHFAAQVAVTSSLLDPLHDGEINQRGTLVLLEALRNLDASPPLIFTSTNKVYGALDDVALQVTASRYEPVSPAIRNSGIDESRPLQFCSPYGCSKGAADQYVLDYAKSFGLPTMCLRMSCIYGRRQFGNEDQGWVAHFVRQAVTGQPIVIYGDGLQVRDVLFADDLVEAMLLARTNLPALQGNVFNIGGGPGNVLSLVELLTMIEQLAGQTPRVSYRGWRPSDQRYYVSDFRKFSHATGWQPRVSVADGVRRLYDWMSEEFGEPITQSRGQVAL